MRNWDLYFLRLAREVATNSKCLSRRIGAVLVKDKRIISTGYNGPPVGIPHCGGRDSYLNSKKRSNVCPRKKKGFRSGEGLDYCPASHAERNAILTAAKNGISTEGSILYCYCPLPCKECIKEIIQAGIVKIVCLEGGKYDDMSSWLIEKSKLKVKYYKESEVIGSDKGMVKIG